MREREKDEAGHRTSFFSHLRQRGLLLRETIGRRQQDVVAQPARATPPNVRVRSLVGEERRARVGGAVEDDAAQIRPTLHLPLPVPKRRDGRHHQKRPVHVPMLG